MLKISGGGARTGGRRGAGAGGGLLQLVCRSEYFNLNMQPRRKTSWNNILPRYFPQRA